jgi:hypothetical protein
MGKETIMRNWKPVSLLFVLAVVLLLLLEAVASPAIRVLTDSQKLGVTGGGNCQCRKANACGSAYCEKVDGEWKNCSGNTRKYFCVASSKADDFCDSDGQSVPCGKWQKCTNDQCNSCEPQTPDCSRTESGTDSDTLC